MGRVPGKTSSRAVNRFLIPYPLPFFRAFVKRLLLLLLLLPLASAHDTHEGFLKPGEYLDHGKEAAAVLDAGEQQNYTLAFGGGPLWEGWLYVMYGDATGETEWTLINHNATEHGSVSNQWTWGNGSHHMIGQFQSEGIYELQVRNVGTAPASVRWSYDQTCDCTFKPMPFSGSYAWFNPALEAGQSLSFWPGAIALDPKDPTKTVGVPTIHATHATGSGPDFANYTIHFEGAIGPQFNLTATESGVQYVLLRLDTEGDARGLLQYSFEVKSEGKGTPAVGPLALLGVALLMARRVE